MVLTDTEIRNYCINTKSSKENLPLIVPFDENALQSESYDLSIGRTIAILKKEVKCISLYDQTGIDSMYEEKEIPNSGYVLSPKEYVLVSLQEQITLPDNLTAHIRPRTRFTRLGLIVSDQHCNSTYSGNLKLGLFNATDYAIKICSGIRIAQIVFEELKSIPSEQKQYKNKQNSIYQNEKSFVGAKFSDELNSKVKETLDSLLAEDE